MSERLDEQKRYYAERAPEYDDWWYRRGRYEFDLRDTANGHFLYGGGAVT